MLPPVGALHRSGESARRRALRLFYGLYGLILVHPMAFITYAVLADEGLLDGTPPTPEQIAAGEQGLAVVYALGALYALALMILAVILSRRVPPRLPGAPRPRGIRGAWIALGVSLVVSVRTLLAGTASLVGGVAFHAPVVVAIACVAGWLFPVVGVGALWHLGRVAPERDSSLTLPPPRDDTPAAPAVCPPRG